MKRSEKNFVNVELCIVKLWSAIQPVEIVENRVIKFLNEQYITANRKTGNVTQFYGMIL